MNPPTTIQIVTGGGIAGLALVTIFQAGVLWGQFKAHKETSDKNIEQNRVNIGHLFKTEREQDTQIIGTKTALKALRDTVKETGDRLEQDIRDLKKTVISTNGKGK
jgi:gamma-glutamylcysteine synthetase